MRELLVSVAISATVLCGCTSLPPLGDREVSTQATNTSDTRLGKAVEHMGANQPSKSGVYALGSSLDAFAARVLLMRAADRTLDIQYYIWHPDTTGYLMLAEVLQAAERGVRVRMLLDDNGIAGLDPELAALNAHPNIEVRLFNPFVNRKSRVLGYMTDFRRLNRRMHNKSLTADVKATIIGGRNIGDAYSGADSAIAFRDLDVLAAGAIATDVTNAFDEYWNSRLAYPAEAILEPPGPEPARLLETRFTTVRTSPAAVTYTDAVRNAKFVDDLLADRLTLEWVPMQLVYDPVIKAEGTAKDESLVLSQIRRIMGSAEREIDLVSPYFVPRREGTETLSDMAGRGIRLRIVTNSLAANDVIAVHAGYANWRKALLRAGVRIYETKPDAAAVPAPASVTTSGSGGSTSGSGGSTFGSGGSFGSSTESLHAKTFSIDRRQIFVGSFNFDPRSYRLNTEMGLMIDSPTLARELSESLDRMIEREAYELKLKPEDGSLQWIEQTDQGPIQYHNEPKSSFIRRFRAGFASLIPVESML